MKRGVWWSLLMLVILAGSPACGNKGPLYLPGDQEAPATPDAVPAE